MKVKDLIIIVYLILQIQQILDKPNGRGVFLMKNLADKVEFNNNGQEVLLTFNLN
jgi:anti-sigma regulatory factor (Ser/Thr protein kinase)